MTNMANARVKRDKVRILFSFSFSIGFSTVHCQYFSMVLCILVNAAYIWCTSLRYWLRDALCIQLRKADFQCHSLHFKPAVKDLTLHFFCKGEKGLCGVTVLRRSLAFKAFSGPIVNLSFYGAYIVTYSYFHNKRNVSFEKRFFSAIFQTHKNQ
jgi:hypothetical protein